MQSSATISATGAAYLKQAEGLGLKLGGVALAMLRGIQVIVGPKSPAHTSKAGL